ncbi:MAG: translation elongation factor Ts, partial [Bacteroidota bacterium]
MYNPTNYSIAMITAQDVKKLRDLTGAGMMDCKKALIEANGDFEKAIDYLRKKGQKVSAARAGNTTSEGAIFVHTNTNDTQGVIVALSCETDFVAKTEAFQTLGQQIADAACGSQPSDIDALLQLTIDGAPVQDKITALVGKIGEKTTISAYKALHSETVVPYIHTGDKLGVLVGLEGSKGVSFTEAGQDVAMQVAAMSPLAV